MKRVKYLFFLVFLPIVAFGQTAEELTKELERTYLAGEGISATFSLGAEGKMSLTVAPHTNKFRIETNKETIVSDGTTTWNFNKTTKHVVVDAVGKSNKKEMRSISEMFIFSNNYSSKVASSKKNSWALVLTPLDPVKKIFDQSGISSITFSLQRSSKAKPLIVTSIAANSGGIKTKLGNVKISVLKKIPQNTFSFIAPKEVKVTDLRE